MSMLSGASRPRDDARTARAGPFSLRSARAPAAAVEIAPGHVSGASLDIRGGRPVVAAHGLEAVPEGALAPSLTARNVRDPASLGAALSRVLERVGRPRRIGLVVPDPVAKVSLVRFEHVPARARDLDELIRWQMRKAAPFSIDEAVVSYTEGARTAEGQEYIVTLARRAVVEEYEQLCAAAGVHAGIVDIATLNVVNAALAGGPPPETDWLLVHVASTYASLAIVRGPYPIFFRSRGAEDEGTLADLVHQTAMYYEDRLRGPGVSRVLLCGAATAGVPQAAADIAGRLGIAVEAVDVREAAALTDRITVAPTLLDTLAPLVGVLLRDREVKA